MKIISFLFLCLIVLPLGVYAQDAPETTSNHGDFTAGKTVTFDLEKKDSSIKDKDFDPLSSVNIPEESEGTVVGDKYAGRYLQPTVENLSRLYWKTNALSLDDDTAIDNFLLINECPIYNDFHSDDFEWLRVRNAARKMLNEKKDGFSNKFKMIVPIDLGRYDMAQKGFPIINETAFIDLKRVEIGGNFNKADICGNTDNIEGYPRNMILILSKPFTFDFVKLDEHIAQAYIIRQRYEPAKKPDHLRNLDYNRLAFARVRIAFDKYQGKTRGPDNQDRAIMFGHLEGIDIFEDFRERRLLTSVDLD